MSNYLLKSTATTTGRPLPKLLLGLLLLLTLTLTLQACGSGDGGDDQAKPALDFVTPTPRSCTAADVDNTQPVDEDVIQLACDNSNFAFDLYSALSDGEDNLFFSPFSISQVLAMAYAGARGETERQMADTLRYGLPQDRLHPAFNALDLALHSRGKDAFNQFESDEENPNFRLNIANTVWGQEGFGFRGEFMDTLANDYGGEMRRLNFSAAPEESRVTINDWVAEETEDKIKDLIPRDAIDSLTRFVLTNAIYFNAQWRSPFNPADTKEQLFHLLDGKKVDVPMMTRRSSVGWFDYVRGDGFQAVDIPYYTGGMSMLVLLPDKGKFDDFDDSLTAGILDLVQKQWEERDVTLNMPRFEFESAHTLKETLERMGMPDAFVDTADFSGITDEIPLKISDVFHKAFVSVDEKGTEAAAATAVMGMLLGGRDPLEPITVTLDRPFIFLIRDEPTGTILFLGRVMDPS